MISPILAIKYKCKVHTKAIINKHTHYHTTKSAQTTTLNYHQNKQPPHHK